jgi:hypothetical protein
MLANIRQKFESMTEEPISISVQDVTKCNVINTYPLSPVASTKFFHSGCSHISSAASAVSVHQQRCRLNNSFSVNFGRKVAMAFRMLTSDASG